VLLRLTKVADRGWREVLVGEDDVDWAREVLAAEPSGE